MCREHVDAGHRGREHSGAAVVGVTDVEHGMGEHDHLVRSGLFVRRCVGIEGYYRVLNKVKNIYYVQKAYKSVYIN